MDANRKYRSFSTIAMIIVAVLWGTSYIVIKDALNDIKPFTLMAIRFTLSTILLSIGFFKRLKGIKIKDIYSGCIIGIFLFLSFLTMVIGIRYTTVSKQSFLIAAFVLIVPFLTWAINKRKPDIYSITGAALATIGIGLLTLSGSLSLNKGDIISILSSLFFACHMISIEYFNKDTDPIVLTIIQFGTASLLFIGVFLIFEPLNLAMPVRTVFSLSYLIVIATVIAFAIQNIAQKYISSSSTALILTLEPVSGSIFAVMLLNETMTLQMLAGCIIIFTGILIQETKPKLAGFSKISDTGFKE